MQTLAPPNDLVRMAPLLTQKPNVLVVDDEAITRSIVSARVRALGTNAVEAEDGLHALDRLREHKFDLAIVDLDMPNMNGLELITAIRTELKLRHLPIVVLTGNEIKAALDGALCAGATSFLQKPLNWACFGPHIRHLLRI
jgi:CheY-like chemotaxis protein